MKEYIFMVIFILGFLNQSFSQFGVSYETRQALELYNTNKFTSGNTKSTLTEVDYEGSPYLMDEFINGSIFTVQKFQYDEVPLRYNIFEDELEFKTPTNEILALAMPEIVERAVMGETTLAYLSYEEANKTKKGFFVLLEEGNASLYAKPAVMYKKATPPAAYKDPEPAKFLKKPDEYYIGFGSGTAILIKNKKSLVATFPDKQDKIEKYISKNKIKTNKPESLIELVRYYNSL
jgi:hypothetical protein